MKKGEIQPGCWKPVAGAILTVIAGLSGLGLMAASWWMS
jgi:hypothetical protein